MIKDLNFEEIRESEIAALNKIKNNYPNLPDYLKERIDLWLKTYDGDEGALMELSLLHSVITQEEYSEYEKTKKEAEEIDKIYISEANSKKYCKV